MTCVVTISGQATRAIRLFNVDQAEHDPDKVYGFGTLVFTIPSEVNFGFEQEVSLEFKFEGRMTTTYADDIASFEAANGEYPRLALEVAISDEGLQAHDICGQILTDGDRMPVITSVRVDPAWLPDPDISEGYREALSEVLCEICGADFEHATLATV